MTIAWLAMATICFTFTAIPMVVLYHQPSGRAMRVSVVIFCAAISLLASALALWLVWHALCRVTIAFRDETLVVRRAVLGIGRARTFTSVERITIVRQWHHRKHGGRHAEEVLVIRTEGQHQWISSALETRNLDALFDWLRENTTINCIDARDRAPIGA